MNDDYESYISQDLILPLGKAQKIKLGFASSFSILYSGMPSKDVFSLVIMETYGNQGFSYSLFYPKDTLKITLKTKTFSIIRIDAETLTIREEKNNLI